MHRFSNKHLFRILQYTAEEADWYGYSLSDATERISAMLQAKKEARIVPLKHEFRMRLIEDLKSSGMENVERVIRTEQGKIVDMTSE